MPNDSRWRILDDDEGRGLTEQMAVRGGSLYRVTVMTAGGGTGVALAFVPERRRGFRGVSKATRRARSGLDRTKQRQQKRPRT
jgi:hypothetical protein